VAGAGAAELGDPTILNLVTITLDRIRRGSRPAIYGADYPTPDGTCVRDFVHVEDLARAHVAALEGLGLLPPGTCLPINIGTGTGTSVRQIVEHLMAISGSTTDIEWAQRRDGDAPMVVASPQRAAELLGWRAIETVESMLESAWAASVNTTERMVN